MQAALCAGEQRFEPVEIAGIDEPWFKTKRGMQIPVPEELRSQWSGSTLAVKRDSWPTTFGVEAALDAVCDADRATQHYVGKRVAVCNGTLHGSTHALIEYLLRANGDAVPDTTLLAELPAIVAARIAEAIDARGPCLTFNTACSAGLNAIGQGARLIESGRADCVVAGGHDCFSMLSFAGFTSFKSLDPRGTRPFDVERGGLSLADGAAFVVLERREAVEARGGAIRSVVQGYGYLGEAHHPTAPHPGGRGIEAVMRRAVAESSIPAQLSLVSAHGTGTLINDEAELRAVERVAEAVGTREPVDVVSLKSQVGHSLGAAGAVQVVATILAMEAQLVPANATLSHPIPHGPQVRLPRRPYRRPISLALCNALGFGGSVASLALADPSVAL